MSRVERGLLPSDVLPDPDERIEYADKIKKDLERHSYQDGHQAMIVGQLLHDMARQQLWRYYADSWSEFINDVGLTSATEFQRRKNYEYFILAAGLDISDDRLARASGSKLFLATKKRNQAWVRENMDEFLDLASQPLGEGGLTRADLAKYIEEQIGIQDEDEDSAVRTTLRTFRRGVVQYSSLPDDGRDVLAQAVRDDDDIYENLRTLVEWSGRKRPSTAPVPPEVVEEDLGEEWE